MVSGTRRHELLLRNGFRITIFDIRRRGDKLEAAVGPGGYGGGVSAARIREVVSKRNYLVVCKPTFGNHILPQLIRVFAICQHDEAILCACASDV
jgi:hypothetical protein